MNNPISLRRYGPVMCATLACIAALAVNVIPASAMTLAEREKMELKNARRPPPAAAAPAKPADAPASPAVAKAPKPKPTPIDLHGLANVPERFVQPLQGKSCGCEAYADTLSNGERKDLIFSSDGHQGVIYRKNLPYFLPHLLHSSVDGADSNLYGSTDLRIRTVSQRASADACSAFRDVPANGSCADGTIDVVIDNQNQKPIKAVFVCGC
jgi:hypothetical protein